MPSKAKTILSNILSAILTIICVLLFLFSICFLTYNLSCGKTRVRGFSMRPTINSNVADINADGDIVYINPNAELKHNNIVVANVAWWSPGSIIKRLVALPHDKLQIIETGTSYDLKVNGNIVYSKQKIDQDYNVDINAKRYYQNKYLAFINNTTQFDGQHIDHSANIGEYDGEPCIVLGDDEYFFVGDNWGDSMIDCMTHGPVNKKNIIGTVDLKIDVQENVLFKVGEHILKIIFSV